jgi:phosphoribosylamine--glycine ligase
MKVLLIGSGGREHALAYKIAQSQKLDRLFILPGNPGTNALGENINLPPNDFDSILSFCYAKSIELVVIGPEQPLVEGMGDFLRKNGLKVFGPNQNAAQIEGHKTFAKNLMRKYFIPTADFVEFNFDDYEKALNYLKNCVFPIVIKADGLAAGKGVLICNNFAEAEKAIDEIFNKKIFGSSGDKIIIEEFLTGEEASIFAITDGDDYICLPSAQDHKRIGESDTGKNTGGMGAYSPAQVISLAMLSEIKEKIISPTLNALREENKKFNGCLYCGLMITTEGPKVVEFNCRFGDPETQVVLPLLEGDFLELLVSTADGRINKNAVKYNNGAAVCVVAASQGYPDSYKKGFEILGLDKIDKDIIIFQAGTKYTENKIVTNGGRVLGVTAIVEKNDLKEAKLKAYDNLKKIYFDGIYFRNDIADKGINKL